MADYDRNALAGDLYGLDYADPRFGMDAADADTRDVTQLMTARQAEKDREPYEALTRLLTSAIPLGSYANRLALGQRHLGEAINKHVDIETRRNASITGIRPWNEPFVRAYLAGATPPIVAAARRFEAAEKPMFPGDARTLGKADSSNMMKGHARDTAEIMSYLDNMHPLKQTLY